MRFGEHEVWNVGVSGEAEQAAFLRSKQVVLFYFLGTPRPCNENVMASLRGFVHPMDPYEMSREEPFLDIVAQ